MQDPMNSLLARPVSALMREVVTAVTPSMHLRAAARLLSERGISAAPVVDESWRAVGVVSKSDLVRRAASAPARNGTSGYYVLVHGEPLLAAALPGEVEGETDSTPDGVVGDVMATEVLSVTSDEPLRAAVTLMVRRGIHRVLVRDAGEKLVGMLSTMDVLRGLVPELGEAPRDLDGF